MDRARVGYLARKDGTSPLSLEFAVTEQQITKGSDWSISVTYFRDLGPEPLAFTLKLSRLWVAQVSQVSWLETKPTGKIG